MVILGGGLDLDGWVGGLGGASLGARFSYPDRQAHDDGKVG